MTVAAPVTAPGVEVPVATTMTAPGVEVPAPTTMVAAFTFRKFSCLNDTQPLTFYSTVEKAINQSVRLEVRKLCGRLTDPAKVNPRDFVKATNDKDEVLPLLESRDFVPRLCWAHACLFQFYSIDYRPVCF